MGLVYYLFHVHHWTPEQYWQMNQGGRDITWALASYESDRLEELARKKNK